MEVRKVEVGALLQSSAVFQVPHFQRSYSWSDKQWERLWRDVRAVAADSQRSSHFLGPLVCRAVQHCAGDSVQRYEVIDGQQRLTTLSALLLALRDIAHEIGAAELADEINDYYLVHRHGKGGTRYKLIPRVADRDIWRRLVDREAGASSDKSLIDDAWSWFAREVRAAARAGGEETLRTILSATTQKLLFVSISVADSENSYRIFESLNTTGLSLTEFDLVRNHLFMRVPVDEQENFESRVWNEFEELWTRAAGKSGRGGKLATAFLRHFLMRQVGYFGKGEAFMHFSRWASAPGLTPDQVVATLLRQARIAVEMHEMGATTADAGSKDSASGMRWPSDTLSQRMVQLAWCQAATAMPLVLELFDRREQGQLDREELEGCLLDLISMLVRRAIVGEKTRGYDRKFVEIARKLNAPIRKSLDDELHRLGWPSDAAVLSALATYPIYKSDSAKARIILEDLERDAGHKEKVDLAPLQIEHVLPQTLSGPGAPAWREMLGEGWRQTHADTVHTLGNLTLTGYNPSLSNKDFASKRKTLRESRLALNQNFSGLRNWDGDRIRERTAQLGQRFLARYPVVGDPPPMAVGTPGESPEDADNLALWAQFAAKLAGREPGGQPGKVWNRKVWLTTKFKCLRLVPWVDRRLELAGVKAGFSGADADSGFASARAAKAAVEATIGAALSERPRTEKRGPQLVVERHFPGLGSDAVDAAVVDWLVATVLGLSESLGPVLAQAGLRESVRLTTPGPKARYQWFEHLLAAAREQTTLHAKCGPTPRMWVSGGTGTAGVLLIYLVNKERCSAELYLMPGKEDRQLGKRRFDWLNRHRAKINRELPDLQWNRMSGKLGSSLDLDIPGGYRHPQESWPATHQALITAMIRLHEVLQPLIEQPEFRDA